MRWSMCVGMLGGSVCVSVCVRWCSRNVKFCSCASREKKQAGQIGQLGNWAQWPRSHMSHLSPTTPGLHTHTPVWWSQPPDKLPPRSHTHAGRTERLLLFFFIYFFLFVFVIFYLLLFTVIQWDTVSETERVRQESYVCSQYAGLHRCFLGIRCRFDPQNQDGTHTDLLTIPTHMHLLMNESIY